MSEPNAAGRIKVAVAQPLTRPGDIAGNIQSKAALARQAAEAGARIIVFSECSVTGYDKQLIGIKAAMKADDRRFDEVARMAREAGIAILAGFYEKDGEQTFNSAFVFFPDGRRLLQRKHYIIDWEADTHLVSSGPRKREIFEIEGVKFAILICADSGLKGIHEELASQGVDCILAPTAGMGHSQYAFHLSEMSNPARLKEYVSWAQQVCFIDPTRMLQLNISLACCNQLGYDSACSYFQPGHAAVIDRTGEVSALLPGKFIVEHHRPLVAVGEVSRRV